jgi:hypothetical protein
MFACAQLGKVEKAKIHWFFNLVGIGAGEQHPEMWVSMT